MICNNTTNNPIDQEIDPCDGVKYSTQCVIEESALTILGLPANSTQQEINLALQNAVYTINNQVFEQNNLNKFINFTIDTDTVSAEEVAAYINALPQFTVNEFETLIIKVVPNYEVGDVYSFLTTVFALEQLGKDTYGTGGTPITATDLEIISRYKVTISDIVNLPETQFIELGDVGSTDIVTAFNAHTFLGTEDPIQSQDQGYVLINVTIDGNDLEYLFVGLGGAYGTGGTEVAVEEDFVLLTGVFDTVTDPINNTSQLVNDGSDGTDFYVEWGDLYIGNAIINGLAGVEYIPSALDFRVWGHTYRIDGVTYVDDYVEGVVTIGDGHPTLDRKDTFIILDYTPSTATLTLTGGVGSIDSVLVDGVDILGAPVAYSTSLAETAGLVVNQINTYCIEMDLPYNAKNTAEVITVTSRHGYEINTTPFTYTATTMTAAPTDFTGGDNATKSVGVITGIAALLHYKPVAYVDSEVEVSFIDVHAGATSFTAEFQAGSIYDENVGTGGGEWDKISGAAGEDFDYAGVTPFSGAKCIYLPAFNPAQIPNDSFVMRGAALAFNYTADGVIYLQLRTTAAWDNNTRIYFQIAEEGVATSTVLQFNRNSIQNIGFNHNLLNEWQTVAINLSDFGYASSTFNEFRFIRRNTPILLVDKIRYAEGLNDVPYNIPTLQEVTDADNVTTNQIVVDTGTSTMGGAFTAAADSGAIATLGMTSTGGQEAGALGLFNEAGIPMILSGNASATFPISVQSPAAPFAQYTMPLGITDGFTDEYSGTDGLIDISSYLTTASEGLTKTGNDIQLGGTLTAGVTKTISGDYGSGVFDGSGMIEISNVAAASGGAGHYAFRIDSAWNGAYINATTGIGLTVNASAGTAIYATGGTGSAGIHGFNNGSDLAGVYATVSNGSEPALLAEAVLGGSGGILPAKFVFRGNVTTGGVEQALVLERFTDNAAIIDGYGIAQDFSLSEVSGSNTKTSNRIVSRWEDVATYTSALDFYTRDTDVLTIKATLSGDGDFRLVEYGSGTITGTATYSLAVDVNGNIIEEALPSIPLISLDEGSGTGYVLADQDRANVGNVGAWAVDFGYSTTPSTTLGATGNYAFNVGYENTVSGLIDIAFGSTNNVGSTYASGAFGYNNTINGTAYTTFLLGHSNSSSEGYSFASGYSNVINNEGLYSHVGGAHLIAKNASAAVFGQGNTDYSFTAGINQADHRMLIVGNGNLGAGNPNPLSTRSDAFIVYHNGDVVAPSLTTAGIDAEATGRVLTTKEWVLANSGGGAFEIIDEGNGDGIVRAGRTAANYGNVGLDAFDASFSDALSSVYGATGLESVAIGKNTIASNNRSISIGGLHDNGSPDSVTVGYNNTLSAAASFSVVIGRANTAPQTDQYILGFSNNTGSGQYNMALGMNNTVQSNTRGLAIGTGQNIDGNYTVGIGTNINTESYQEVAIGMNNTTYVASSEFAWNTSDRAFVVGIGENSGSRADGLTILKNGDVGIGINNFEAFSTTAKFNVNGDVRATDYGSGTVTGTATYFLAVDANGYFIEETIPTLDTVTDSGSSTTNSISVNTVTTIGYTVAGLPAGTIGERTYVTDSTVAASGNFGATVVGGGSNTVPVFFDGTNWIIA